MSNSFSALRAKIIQTILYTILVAIASSWLPAQDSRTVTEPTFPPSCTVLTANQTSSSLDETSFDTARLQTALNTCAVGQAVELATGSGNDAFLIQPITIPSGVTLLVDAGVTVFTSLNRADYPCPGSSSSDCTPIITIQPGSGSGIMGYGIIDGRGGQNLNGETVSWWTQTQLDPRPRMIQLVTADNFTLYKITLQNSPKFHVFGTGNFFTAWGVKITAPTTSPNTDGIDPSGSHDITITKSYISDGDDHVAIKAGVGHVSNVTVSNSFLYQGHGVSIGSETNAGAENVLVTDIVMDGAAALNQNVIRIKSDSSKGGEVKNITYRNICAQNPGHPLVFNPFNSSSTGTLFPNFHDILVQNYHVLNRQNSSTLRGYNVNGVNFPLGITFDNVEIDGFKSTGTTDFPATQVNNANFNLGPGPVTPASPGIVSVLNTLAATAANNVTVTNNISNSNPPFPCSAASFVYLAGELFVMPNDVTVDNTGQTITVSAIVQTIVSGAAAPTGTVSVLENGSIVATAPVGGRITQIPIVDVGPGQHTYTAQYSGDANYAPLSFGSLTISGTTTALVSTPALPVYGQPVTLTATVSSDAGTPAGSVAFLDGSASLGTAQLDGSGVASITVPSLNAGSHALTANYSGGSIFEASSTSLALTVAPVLLTITADNQTMVFGSPVPPLTFTPAGFVNGDTAAVLSGAPMLASPATSTSRVGTYPITIGPGTLTAANYAFAFVNGTLTITQATPVVNVICPADADFNGRIHFCLAKVIGVDGRLVFGLPLLTYNGFLIPPAQVGTYNVSATFFSFNPNYTNATGTGTLTIDPRHDGDE